jgi:hypothetical protein
MTKRIIGATDEQTVCDACGREELKLTVIIGDEDGYEIGRYGTSCADMVLGNGKGRRTTAQKVREIEECRKGEIYNKLAHFEREMKSDFGYAMTFLVSAIEGHNRIPHPATAKAINVRLDTLAKVNQVAANAMRAQVN